mmetsp:Transcript_4562/g.11759  ORF Transcript_4562/g.11759 Transcript_4562/m.11759 type:complete len:80 (+) Transcript_4562:2699-2938(+)
MIESGTDTKREEDDTGLLASVVFVEVSSWNILPEVSDRGTNDSVMLEESGPNKAIAANVENQFMLKGFFAVLIFFLLPL